jgi:SAM-dependent methyltransferase
VSPVVLRHLRDIARAVAPPPVRRVWGTLYGQVKIRRARRAFEMAEPGSAAYLDAADLSALMGRGYRPPGIVRYDAEGLRLRAQEKLARLQRVIDLSSVRRCLELGTWDGMVGALLADRGIAAYGLDIVSDGVDERAVRAGVCFIRSDAAAIALRDGSVDLVCSFGSLEHFARPDRCLLEVARVLRRGGHAYFDFGPLYYSPYGRHAYRQIPVPFCHLLFPEESLHSWADSSGLPHDWPYVNGWTLEQYRTLWQSLSSTFDVTSYREATTGGVGIELVAKYAQHFRSQVPDFDELLVAHVEIVLRKR